MSTLKRGCTGGKIKWYGKYSEEENMRKSEINWKEKYSEEGVFWSENNVIGKILGRGKYAEEWNKLDGKICEGKEVV